MSVLYISHSLAMTQSTLLSFPAFKQVEGMNVYVVYVHTAALDKVGDTSPVLASPRNILGYPPFLWPNASVPMDSSTLMSESSDYSSSDVILFFV